MAASRIDGIGVDLTYAGFEVDAKSSQSCSWSLGCEIVIEEIDAPIQEIKVNDVVLSGKIYTKEISVDIDTDRDSIMNLDVSVAIGGISSTIATSQVSTYDEILEITSLSPESVNEKKYAASALAAKKIYDSISELNQKVDDLSSATPEIPDIDLSDCYTKKEIDVKVTAINNRIAIFEEWFKDDGNGNIKTTYDFYSTKTLAAGAAGSAGSGEGDGGGGSVNAISVDGAVYSPTDGIIDLSRAFANVEVDLSDYATKSALSSLQGEVDNIESVLGLSESASGYINTWNEVVAFLDGYSQSDDLATILSGINGNVTTLQGYFTEGIANKATADSSGNVITSTYAKQSTSIIAGSGLTGGGTLAADRTINVVSANDGITVNADNIQLNTVNTLTSTSTNKPLSAAQGKALSERIAVFEEWFKDDGSGNIKTTYNFYSTKAIAAGGAGEEGGAGGGGVALLTSWKNLPSSLDGYALGANLGVDLNSRVTTLEGKATAVSFAQTLTSGKAIGTITIDGTSKVLYAPATYAWGEITSKPNSISGYGITDSFRLNNVGSYVGVRFTGGENATGSKYLEWWNSAGWVHHKAGKYSIAGGTSSQFLKADGSVDGTAYLPLSGGTLTGTLVISGGADRKIVIDNTDADTNWNLISFCQNGVEYGRLGTATDTNLKWNGNTLIHSGNIGERALNISGTNARPTLLTPYENLNDYGYGYYSYVNANDPENKYGTNAALFAFRSYRGNDTWQIAFDGNGINNTAGPNFAIRGNFANTGWTAWYRIATTSSNVASATKLQTARTIWGQSFDGTGNVSGNILGGTKLFTIYGYDDNGNTNIIDCSGINKQLWIGYGSAAKSYNTELAGNNIYFHHGTSRSIGMVLNSSGNVTIGGSDLAGTDTKLYVAGSKLSLRLTTATEMHLYAENSLAKAGILISSTGKSGLYDYKNDKWIIVSEGTTKTWLGNGNVGIGTTYPQYKLDVNGTLRASGATTLSGTLSVTGATTLSDALTLANNKAIKYLNNAGTGIVAMHLDADNNFLVGFGVASAGYNTYIDGYNIHFRYSKSRVGGMTLNSSGALSIGGTVDVSGLLTAKAGIKIAAGQSITFLDSAGDSHTLSYDSANKAFKFAGSMYATGQIAAGAVAEAGGSNEGGTGSSVSFSKTLTSGTAIGTLTIDGTSQVLYAPNPTTSLAWSAITGKPTTISGYGITDAVTLTGSQALVNKTYNGYTLGAACAYNVTTSVSSGSTSLVTSGAVFAALQALSNNSSGGLGEEIPLEVINGTGGAIPNNSVIICSSAATLDFRNVVPELPDKPCIVYLMKGASVTVSVPVFSSSGIGLVTATGAVPTSTTQLNLFNGLTLIWAPSFGGWKAYVSNA